MSKKFIADFHIHSHFSMATSKKLTPEWLDYWAHIKGIKIVGTGDFTHPGWVQEMKEKLEPAEEGLFKLQKKYELSEGEKTLSRLQWKKKEAEPRFILTAEISSIYKKNGKVRKVHNVVMAPDFETVEKIQQKLINICGNITSDGRPILGLDSRDLLEMCLEANENICFIPAHIWTPWFSALGAKSGFDSIAECYDDLAHHIYAVETGLSSDAPMNWMCRSLDQYTLISNSDAHSPEKLGRNANIFNTAISYSAILNALKTGDPKMFLGTIDMFPQEGKYHYAGHRKCGVCVNPVENLASQGVCKKCGKSVTQGVMERVVELSDREQVEDRPNRHPFQSIIPLKEIISEIEGVGEKSKKVEQIYSSIIAILGPELEILLETPLDKITKKAGLVYGEAIKRMRNRQVYIQEGYDGEYGVIRCFDPKEDIKALDAQNSLFGSIPSGKVPDKRPLLNFDLKVYQRLRKFPPSVPRRGGKDSVTEPPKKESPPVKGDLGGFSEIDQNPSVLRTSPLNKEEKKLNVEQRAAVEHYQGTALVLAGPGSGKTRVLTYRIAHLINKKGVKPENILAITFTNKAAGEMRERVGKLLGAREGEVTSPRLQNIMTFHALGYALLKKYPSLARREAGFVILDDQEQVAVLRGLGVEPKMMKEVRKMISEKKQNVGAGLVPAPNGEENTDLRGTTRDWFEKYEQTLKAKNAFDFDDMLYHSVLILSDFPEILKAYRAQYSWIMVDEYQDTNQIQYELLRLLAPNDDSNLCVIGDPNQAIYGFRGAKVEFIQKFQDDYPEAAVYNLKQSYRCSDSILEASTNVIFKGEQLLSRIRSTHKGVKIKISSQKSDTSEAEFVARTIQKLTGGVSFFAMDSQVSDGHGEADIQSLSDFAVLCRTKSLFKRLEKAFVDHSIPYQRVGDDPFFKQELISSIIGKVDAESLQTTVDGDSVREVQDMLRAIIDRDYAEEKEGQEREFKRLLDMAKAFGTDKDRFLQYVKLGITGDDYQRQQEAVTLMTLHAAKGLEFKCVFIVGCEEGILPYGLYENQISDPDEERRLLYVGMTRAEKYLYLSHAEKRFLHGQEYTLPRSSFLDGIKRELVEEQKVSYKKKSSSEDGQERLF